jgi:nitroimidazol reductase NimA-like FMN-containing flavoprotein (pyridoxamine 5'-phosphate oxidase superfamily)
VPTPDERGATRALDEPECRRLLAAGTVGRLGFTDGALPAILPVVYLLQHGNVLIPSGPRDRLAGAVRRSVVVFEIGALDPVTLAGWSVSVVGAARVISDPGSVSAVDSAWDDRPLPPPPRCYVSVRPGLVQGWRTDVPAAV